MFSTKSDVDDHVYKLLKNSTNQFDTDLQCFSIAKLYFDIKEYATANGYVDRYLKVKRNNENGLLLKAKILEMLNESENVLRTYESLYFLYKKDFYLNRICELLQSMPVNVTKIKQWIKVVHENCPNHKEYEKLHSLLPEKELIVLDESNLEKLCRQSTQDDKSKMQYLHALENSRSYDILSKCLSFLEQYSFLEPYEAVRIYFRIFKSNFKLLESDKKCSSFYCLILTAVLTNRSKFSDFEIRDCLKELLNLLFNIKSEEGTTEEFIYQFIFLLTEVASEQICLIRNPTVKVKSAIVQGYLACCGCRSSDEGLSEFPDNLQKWITKQARYRCSIANHICVNNEVVSDDDTWLSVLFEIVWPNETPDYSNVNKYLRSNKPLTLENLIELDLNVIDKRLPDLSTVLWQLHCLNCSNDECISKNSASYLQRILSKVFCKLPDFSLMTKCPDNISKMDIATFVLGSLMTYKKLYKGKLDNMLGSLDVVKIRLPDVLSKFWIAICDFVLQNKKNTQIGLLREVLKKGLEAIQEPSKEISENCRLYLGHMLYQYSTFTNQNVNAIIGQSVKYSNSVIFSSLSDKCNTFKNLPISSISRNSFNSQLKASSQLGKLSSATSFTDMFDVQDLSDKVLGSLKFDACLRIISWYLNCAEQNGNFKEIEQALRLAEQINSKHPELLLLKSKICMTKAQFAKSTGSVLKIQDLIQDANIFVKESYENLTYFDEKKRESLNFALQAQLDQIKSYSEQEISLLDFTCDETSNSNFHQSFECYSNRLDNDSDFTMATDNRLITDDLLANRFHYSAKNRMMISKHSEKISELSYGVDRNQDAILSLDSRAKRHDEIYSNLTVKFEVLLQRFGMLEDRHEQIRRENSMKQELIDSLNADLARLQFENKRLKQSVDGLRELVTDSIFEQSIETNVNLIEQFVDGKLDLICSDVASQLQCSRNIALVMQMKENNGKKQRSKKKEEKEEWQCSTCFCFNKLPFGTCQECGTIKARQKNDLVEDLTKFSKGKWECSGCYCMNDDAVNSCPACSTRKVNDNKIDLSTFSKGKWQCSDCLSMNSDSFDSCPACQAQKPGVKCAVSSSSNNSELLQKFGVSKPSGGFSFNLQQPLNTANNEAIVFGTRSFNSAPVTFKFGTNFRQSAVNNEMTDSKPKWKCSVCSAENRLSHKQCISCATSKLSVDLDDDSGSNDNDSDVIFVGEPYVTEEQKMRARALQLPDHFYYYENLTDEKSTSDDESENLMLPANIDKQTVNPFIFNIDDSKDTALFSFSNNNNAFNFNQSSILSSKSPAHVVANDNEEEKETQDDDSYDPHYEPIISLPTVSVVTGEEGWKCVFEERCRLFKFDDKSNAWKECGVGVMKVLTQNNISRMLMRRDQVHRVCCNQLISADCPNFVVKPNSKNTLVWFAMDGSENSGEPVKGQFAIKFKEQSSMDELLNVVGKLQSKINVNEMK